MTDRREITIDANDRIVSEGHHGITFGNPEMLQYIRLHYTHPDYYVPVGGMIIP